VAQPTFIPGTRELYSFTVSNTIITNLLTLFKKLQNDGHKFVELLPALPALIDLVSESSLDSPLPAEQLHELKQQAETLAHLQWPVELGKIAERFCLETMATRLTDLFEYYLAQILTRALRTHPGALGDAQIPVQELLECGSIDEALDRKIERKVHDLIFAGLADIIEYLERQFRVTIDRATPSYRLVCEVVEVRHLIVHNNGKVDRRFIRQTGRRDLKLGSDYPLDWQWASSTLHAFSDVTRSIDSAFVRQFRLTQISGPTKAKVVRKRLRKKSPK